MANYAEHRVAWIDQLAKFIDVILAEIYLEPLKLHLGLVALLTQLSFLSLDLLLLDSPRQLIGAI